MKHIGKPFQPGASVWLHIFLIALAIFILGVQVGIKHGRTLEREDIYIEHGIFFTD